MSFVHLHVHSEYSLLESSVAIDDLTSRAQTFGMPAVALTDAGNMFGAIEFYFSAKEKGLKPILGLEVFLAPKGRLVKGEDKDSAKLPTKRLVLLAQDYQGYQNLCRISTIGYKEGFYYRPRVDYDVLKAHHEHLLCLTGGQFGEIPQSFNQLGEEIALEKIRALKGIFNDRLYLEINRTGVKSWDQTIPFLLEASRIESLPIVAANDVHYLKQEDQVAQEVLICIGTNKTLHDETRFRLGSDQFYFKSPEAMKELFADLPNAVATTLEIAERCDLKFKLKTPEGRPIYHLPSFPTQQGRTLRDEIKVLSLEGLNARFDEASARGEPIAEDAKSKYLERLDFELSVIDRMDFNGYFLIVQDFIGWAKNHQIPVGPGRGSGAGSLVAYSLRITDLDPMPYNLIFERFLNPERISMPDFDVDFCQEHRHRVIDYVTKKYGEQSVSQIITYGKLQARAAIRDVGRVMGMTFSEVDLISKLMPDKLGITLKEAIAEEPRLRDLMESDPKVSTVLDLAQKVEGLVRHAGIHAAGVIIADGDINSLAPLYRGADGENVVQYDMKHAEKMGLIKFDFLGLKTLTQVQHAFELILKNRQKQFDVSQISLSDAGIYDVMCKGDLLGIFQFEGEGITDLVKKAQPRCFEDIVALNALYRPGPMDMIPDYLSRKQGTKVVEYLFPQLETLLKETYGIIVYQEQVQLIAAHIASYSLGEADLLRRAMGKKNPEEMAKQKDRFLDGAKKNQFDVKKAAELFDLMAEFAKYGFNKSHAAAYCVVAAYTAWLKNYYPVEFFASLLSTEMGDTDKVVKYIKDVRRHRIELQPPHINHSEFKFSVVGDVIYFSLGAIKGVGESAVEAIVEARKQSESGKFSSLEDFFGAVDLRRVNKKTIESLIKAGAMDGFGYDRSTLFSGFSKFIEAAERTRNEKELGQSSLFSLDEDAKDHESVRLETQAHWTKTETLKFEKDVLGFFLSDHPVSGYVHLSRRWASHTVEALKEVQSKTTVRVLGLVGEIREVITKKGTRMAFGQFEDLTGGLELIVFPDAWAAQAIKMKSDSPVVVTGNLEKDGETLKILVQNVERIEDLMGRVKSFWIRFRESSSAGGSSGELGSERIRGDKLDISPDSLRRLREILQKHEGSVKINFDFELSTLAKRVVGKLEEPSGVKVSGVFIEDLQAEFGNLEFFDLVT